MEAKQLSELCIDGSQCVYDYVSKRRNGGAQEINVDLIEHIEEQEYKFKLEDIIVKQSTAMRHIKQCLLSLYTSFAFFIYVNIYKIVRFSNLDFTNG